MTDVPSTSSEVEALAGFAAVSVFEPAFAGMKVPASVALVFYGIAFACLSFSCDVLSLPFACPLFGWGSGEVRRFLDRVSGFPFVAPDRGKVTACGVAVSL